MKPFSVLLAAACASMSWLATAQEVACPCDEPVLRAATFNANGGYRAPYRAERVTALATELPQLANGEGLDVLCVNELWDGDVRGESLQGFLNDPNWYLYRPDPVDQPGCSNACSNDAQSTGGRIINDWVLRCSFVLVPGLNKSCSDYSTTTEYLDCLKYICPDLPGYVDNWNAACNNCLEDADPAETTRSRIFRCALRYNTDDAADCRFANGGQAGATLVSRYPFLETEYHAFGAPASWQSGLSNHGITYGKIQTDAGPVHLFCSNMATAISGMDPAAAEPLNATQSQEVLDYIAAKAGGEMALFLSDTGSGPALSSSPAGPVNAEWPVNFATLEAELADALHTNLDANSQPDSAETCTYGCDDPDEARYVDHIMTSGQGTTREGYTTGLCQRRGGVFFTTAIVSTADGLKPLSDHAGVRTDTCLDERIELACNVDGDDDIDKLDLRLIRRQLHNTVPPLDPDYDADGDGRVTIDDVKLCAQRCSRPRCSDRWGRAGSHGGRPGRS